MTTTLGVTPVRTLRSYCGVGFDERGQKVPQPLILVFDQVLPESEPRILARREAFDRQEARRLAHALYSSLSCSLYEELIAALGAIRAEAHSRRPCRDGLTVKDARHG